MELRSKQVRDFMSDPVWLEISAHLRANMRIVLRDLTDPDLGDIKTAVCRGQNRALALILSLPQEILDECLAFEQKQFGEAESELTG